MSERGDAVAALQRVLLTLWVGGMWTGGYLVAPLLFHALTDRHLAGELAGQMFYWLNYIGMGCGVLLLLTLMVRAQGRRLGGWRAGVVLVMLVLVCVVQFVLTPKIVALKAMSPAGFAPGSALAAQFGMLHGISSLLFLFTSVLGLALVLAGFQRRV